MRERKRAKRERERGRGQKFYSLKGMANNGQNGYHIGDIYCLPLDEIVKCLCQLFSHLSHLWWQRDELTKVKGYKDEQIKKLRGNFIENNWN